MKEILLRNMTVSVSRKKVLRRLGRGLNAEMSPAFLKLFEEEYAAALAIARMDCIAAWLEIAENDGARVLLRKEAGGAEKPVEVTIESGAVCGLLEDCMEAYIMCVTAGAALADAVKTHSADGDTTRALVVDAVGSELVEEAADEVCRYIERTASISLTKRFSPGYGDWDLSGQAELDKALNISRIGVTLNEAFLMTPEKTITAVAGVE